MNELERIKEVERDVAQQVENARKEADASISKTAAEEEQIIQKEVEKARGEIERKSREREVDARREADKIISDVKKHVTRIRNMASKKEDDAIKVILKEFTGG